MMAEEDQLPPVPAELATAQAQLRQLGTELTDAQQELTRARAEHRHAVSELADFKIRVRQTALRYGERHNMCEVLDDALVELDLPPRTREYTVHIRITGYLIRTVQGSDEDAAAQTALAEADIREDGTYPLNGQQFQIHSVTAATD